MSAKRDYYEVIGVSKSASADEIKSQYRKLALKFHPDRNKSADAQEHFKEISEAYAVLSDPDCLPKLPNPAPPNKFSKIDSKPPELLLP